MSDDLLAQAVLAVREIAESRDRAILTEASGTVAFERIANLRATGVDRLSTSAITLRANPIDFGLDEG